MPGVCAGLLLGLSASFDEPVIDDLHVSLEEAATSWTTWGLQSATSLGRTSSSVRDAGPGEH